MKQYYFKFKGETRLGTIEFASIGSYRDYAHTFFTCDMSAIERRFVTCIHDEVIVDEHTPTPHG